MGRTPDDLTPVLAPGPPAVVVEPSHGEAAPAPQPIYPGAVRRTWVSRPRLETMLRRSAQHGDEPVVVVSAPAGAGKSVLARQWLETDDREHLEISLAPRLDEASALARTIVRALEGVGPPAPNLEASITSTEPQLSTILLPALARLAASRTRDFVLVLDDVHLIHDAACDAILMTVCDATPPGSQVVLLSRQEPPAWLARARADGRLVEISGEDLRFDAAEAAELFRRMEVPDHGLDIDDIVEHTEGWAVALYLTGLALRRDHASPREVLSQGFGHPHRFVSDYVTTQVLGPLDTDLQSFVTRTSVLDELGADVCDAVLRRDDSAALLARLQEQLQLVIPMDPLGQRLRYHHLLSDALRSELSRQYPAEVPVLHSRASRWYAERGDMDSAIRHAKAAHDMPEVGRLVWSQTAHCVGSGEKDRLAFWLRDLSEDQLSGDRWLSLAAAWLALQSAEPDRMERYILRCEAHAGSDWRRRAGDDPYAAVVAVIVALAGHTTLAESDALCGAAAGGLPPESGFRAAALFIQGVALTLRRDMDRGRRCLMDAGRLGRVLDVPIIEADALSWQGVLAMAEGDHRAAQRLITGATDVIRDHRLDRLATAAHSITAQALVQALRHDPEAATTVATARRMTAQLGDIVPWFSVCGRLIQARAAIALGDGSLARQLVTEAKGRMTPDLNDSLARDLLLDVEDSLRLLSLDGAASPALTAAETRVLQFLPSHLQLTQIGEHLFISTNTVKSHVTAIHRKLGVSSRAGAVERARELGLLEAPAFD